MLDLQIILGILLIVIIAILIFYFKLVTIFEFELGLLYKNGQFARVLPPGRHLIWKLIHKVSKVDMRVRYLTIPGQEILTADAVSLKISLATSIKVNDPNLFLHSTTNALEAFYLIVQILLRDIVSSIQVEELIEKRGMTASQLLDAAKLQTVGLGLELLSIDIKDIMFPGELKNIFTQVISARKEGQAALERARGESAALRSLANSAKMLENNPELYRLRLLQTLATSSGNSIVLNADNPIVNPSGSKPK